MKTKLFAWISWIAFLVSAVSEWGLDIDLPLTPALRLVMAAIVLFAINAPAQTTNRWTNGSGGKWEIASNWSPAVTPTNNSLTFVTNTTTKTVTIDAATVLSNAINSCLTISNLTLSAPSGITNTLLLSDPGTNLPLRILNFVSISSGGLLVISNGAVQAESVTGTDPFRVDGQILLNSPAARLIETNSSGIAVGYSGPGLLTMSNGFMLTSGTAVGRTAGSQGTLTIAGGTNQLTSAGTLSVGDSLLSAGWVWVTGGRLEVPSTSASLIGHLSDGQMTVSNGTVSIGALTVGSSAAGTLTLAGGTNAVASFFILGGGTGKTGAVWLTGGQLLTTNSTQSTFIGNSGVGQMTMSNGTWLAHLAVLGRTAGTLGALTIAGGTNEFSSSLSIGEEANATGAVWLTDTGRLVVTNGSTFVGARGTGQMSISNGTFIAGSVLLGTNTTATGTLTVAGGTNALTGPLTVGVSGTGAIWVTGGQLVVTNTPATVGTGSGFVVDGSVTLTNGSSIVVSNATVTVGNRGSGILTNFGGLLLASNLTVGSFGGSSGTITIDGGTNVCTSNFVIGDQAGAKGSLWIKGGNLTSRGSILVGNSGTGFAWWVGGQIAATSGTTTVGGSSSGQLIVSNAVVTLSNAVVGASAGGQGTLTSSAGTNSVYGGITVGNFACTAVGTITVDGGRLFVTNATTTAFLEVRSGTVTLSSGTLTIDTLVMTNACGHFIKTGGALSITHTNLTPALDADGDGLPNSWEQDYGLSPFDNTGNNGASGDPDGDGLSNLQEYQGGSNPLLATSVPDAFWINSSSGKWEVGGNWLYAVTPTNNASVFIGYGTPSLTVTIDSVTPTNNMSIKNLAVSDLHTLQITNSGASAPLNVSQSATITNGSVFLVKNAAVSVGTLSIFDSSSSTVTNGSLVTAITDVEGELSLVDSIVTNGFFTFVTQSTDPMSPPAELWMTGGSFVSGYTYIGGVGFGQMTVSNGYALVGQLYIGSGNVYGGEGTLTCVGGTTEVVLNLEVGSGSSTTGTVWLTGGQLVATNYPTIMGTAGGTGQMTVSNGTARLLSLTVGNNSSSGTIAINGGTVTATGVTLGDFLCGGTGTVIVAGGSLFVTNDTFMATLEVLSGTIALNSGTLTVDRLVITNTCGHFVKTGGTFIQNNPPILGAGLDADGDGLPNDWEQAHGLDPLDATGANGATGDPDGDGFTNLQEFQRGTDPQNPSSTPFRITSIVQQGNNVLLTWTTFGGNTNVVQSTKGTAGGSYSNNFADISGNIISNVVGFTSATYLDAGGATNFPARYYRVRLVP